jgi:hypothetical protein
MKSRIPQFVLNYQAQIKLPLFQRGYKLGAPHCPKDQFDSVELLPKRLKNRGEPIGKYGFWRSDHESTSRALSISGDGASFLKEA